MNLMILKWTIESDYDTKKIKRNIGGRYGS